MRRHDNDKLCFSFPVLPDNLRSATFIKPTMLISTEMMLLRYHNTQKLFKVDNAVS